MKKKFTKILGVGLTLALLTSLLLTAAPVAAITQPSVTVSPTTISAVDADYSIRFKLDEQLTGGTTVTAAPGNYDLAGIGDSFVITANAGTDTATISLTKGTVTAAMSGTGTWTPGTGVIAFATAGETATVTVLTVDSTDGLCTGSWARTGTPTAAVGVGDADTITIVFQSDTAVVIGPTATILAGPGWINGIWLGATTTTLTSVVGTVATRTVVITLPATTRIGEGAEVRLAFTAGLTNPSASGGYSLTVATSKETTAVTSAAYTITVPTIPGLPGVASVYNPAGILMAQKNDLSDAVAAAGVDYTIYVGPGTYTDVLTISYAGLTFVSTAGTATTVIDATGLTGPVITISAADVTVEGFTIKPGINDATDKGILVAGADAIVKDNIITSVVSTTSYPEGINIATAGTGATVSGNELSINNTMMVIGATGATLSDNTFGAGINVQGSTDITITGNTLIGVELWGIVFESSASSDILIEDNTISGTTLGDATGIYFRHNLTHDDIRIIGNDITDNEGDGIGIPSGNTLTNSVIKFNTITGNDTSTGDYGIDNDSGVAVDATFNWWGTDVAADIALMVSSTTATTGIVDYDPFLAGAAGTVLSASEVVAGTPITTLDAKTTVGVAVSGATGATTISVAKYIANPQAAIAGAIAFYDVYVVGATADVTIKFYAGDANTDVYLWSAGTLTWGDPLTAVFSVYGGYVYVTVDRTMLTGTPFALVAGTVAAPGTPVIAAPTTGDDTVSLTPIFAWGAVAGADGYYFQLADNANFVTPMVKLDGDLGRLVVTAYAYVGELPYSTAYYWRVQAVSGTVAAGNLAASAWSTGVFITMDEPAEELPPVVVQEQPPVIIEPIVEVITPAATEITPSWIYVIIGVGAVLVIALLVLIVRTRRVA